MALVTLLLVILLLSDSMVLPATIVFALSIGKMILIVVSICASTTHMLVLSGRFVRRMVIFESELISRVKAAVDVEHALQHSYARFTAEVFPIDLIYLPLFHQFRR